GFKDIIDAIGGIDIYIPEEIYDTAYPKGETGLYETFSVDKGMNHMDGAMALKYARSRHTTSDFNRSQRQQDILYAIKEKVLKANILLSKSKIENIFEAVEKNLETDLSAEEIFTLGSYASKITRDKIVQRLIHDDPSQCGGFLYTPERELFDGAFVLIPAGGIEIIHSYINLNFNYPEITRENAKIHVLNGTKREGAAGETKQILQRYCLNINRYGNANRKDIKKTTYYYKSEKKPATLEFLQKLIPGEESTEIPEEYKDYMAGTDIILEMGSDYTESENYMEDPFYSLPMPVDTPDDTANDTADDTATATDTNTTTNTTSNTTTDTPTTDTDANQ
ncbi:MAG: LCP family protein, partial [Candidatus Gracilibacteria bacterium]